LLKPKAPGTYVSYSGDCYYSHAEGIQLYRGLKPCRAEAYRGLRPYRAEAYRGLKAYRAGISGTPIQLKV